MVITIPRSLLCLCTICIILINTVFAHYCEFGSCNENTKYCCGENICCDKFSNIWYYWGGALLVVITIVTTACLYMKKLKNKYAKYNQLEQQFDEITTNA